MRYRLLGIGAGSAAALLVAAIGSAAEPLWPHVALDPDRFRGPGDYLSLPKILTCWLLFLLWVRTTDWVSQDAQIQRLRVHVWNPIVVASFAAAFLLVWVIPAFWFGISLMVVAYAAPLGSYIYFRNAQVEDHRKVLTPDHLRHWVARKLRLIGIRIEEERPAPQDRGPAVQFSAGGGATSQDREARLLKSRQLAGYLPARQVVADALDHRAEAVLLDFSPTGVAVRYLIDGVWHNSRMPPGELNGSVLSVLQTLSATDSAQAAARQSGQFGIRYREAAVDCRITTQAAEQGQRVLLKLQSRGVAGPTTLEELGMRPKMAAQLKELVEAPRGWLLFSSMPGGGLTTTLDVVLAGCDRFVREFSSIEDAQRREHEITNLDVVTYDKLSGEGPETVLPALLRRQPNVVIVRDLINAETVRLLSAEAAQRLMIAGIAARDACEALLRVLLLKAPPAEFAAAVTAVVHSRLVRKLCDKCKEPYPPPPALLEQLGIPAGKVSAFYRPRQESEAMCEECRGTGFRGRSGLFELAPVTAAMRELLIKNPKIDLLRRAAREAGLVSARDQGILMVARGITSLEEVQRVLKQ